MKDGPLPTQNNPGDLQERWKKLDENIKLIGFIVLALGSLLIMSIFGPQALYLLIGIGAIGTFAIYPEIEPERVLWGAAIGALYAGPLGLIVGAALGHYIGKKYDEFMHAVEPIITAVVTAVTTVTATPLVAGPLKLAGALSSAFTSSKAILQNSLNILPSLGTQVGSKDLQENNNSSEAANKIILPTTIESKENIADSVLNKHKVLQFNNPNSLSQVNLNTTEPQAPAPLPQKRRRGHNAITIILNPYM